MRASALALVVALAAPYATAEPRELMASLWSTHLDGREYNDDNRLFAARHGTLVGGTFVNSYYQRSYFAGALIEREARLGLFYGFSAGAMYGYCLESFGWGKEFDSTDCGQTITPYLVPVVGYRYDALSVRALLFGPSLQVAVGVQF